MDIESLAKEINAIDEKLAAMQAEITELRKSKTLKIKKLGRWREKLEHPELIKERPKLDTDEAIKRYRENAKKYYHAHKAEIAEKRRAMRYGGNIENVIINDKGIAADL